MAVAKTSPVITQDFEHIAGATLSLPIDFETDGTPRNISTSTFKMDLRAQSQTAATLTFRMSAGFRFDETLTNRLWVEKTAAEMEIAIGKYNYDLVETMSDGTIRPRLKGVWTITEGITPCPTP